MGMLEASMVVATIPVTISTAQHFMAGLGSGTASTFAGRTNLAAPYPVSHPWFANHGIVSCSTRHIAQIGPARGAWFRDSNGNTLGLRQADYPLRPTTCS